MVTTRTDLSLLLECLKFQMKCPDSQKQTLQTIYSICQKKEDHVDLFREMGGVAFLYNLSKSSIVHPDVKETALFTLGTLSETNVYCRNSLCRKETFSDLAVSLMKEDIPLTQKRVAVYLLSVLVANNRLGQTFAQTTGCLDILLDLFRTSFPLSREATLKSAYISQIHQLWTSVSSALCSCVNNPQNEEAQRICVAAFPVVKTWLQQITLPRTEMFQPICFFIAMTVANNSCAQETFSASGGLETLTLTLVRFTSDAEKSLLSCQLSVIITRTMSACITDNAFLATGLAQYGVVPRLLSLLSSPNLDSQDRLPVVLTLGHCTEASEEHQSQLVQCGGLSTIITVLTESPNEELRKAATFILQTCKQATMSLEAPGPVVTQGQAGGAESLMNMEAYWRSARELLHRINQLEAEDTEGEGPQTCRVPGIAGRVKEDLDPYLPRGFAPPAQAAEVSSRGDRERAEERGRRTGDASEGRQRATACERRREGRDGAGARGGEGCEGREGREERRRDSMSGQPLLQGSGREDLRAERNQREEVRHGDGALQPLFGSHVRRQIFKASSDTQRSALTSRVQEERRRSVSSHQELPHRETNVSVDTAAEDDSDVDQVPVEQLNNNTRCPPAAHTGVGVPGQTCAMCRGAGSPVTSHVTALEGARESHALALCSEMLDNEISRMLRHPVTAPTPPHNRCSGCALRFEEVTSRTFSALQSSCHYSCDVHRALREATNGFRARRRNALFGSKSPDHTAEQTDTRPVSEAEPQRCRNNWRADRPENRRNVEPQPVFSQRRPELVQSSTAHKEGGSQRAECDRTNYTDSQERRERSSFTHEEVYYLTSGVKRFGPSWNSILWSYPFQPGRTNVDLAKKYRRLMVIGTN
ncbi:telomere repeats-binding bouquet formation protein 1 [Polymixia lowei]